MRLRRRRYTIAQPVPSSQVEPNPLRWLLRTDALHDWLRELRTGELLEVFDATVDEQLRRGIKIDGEASRVD